MSAAGPRHSTQGAAEAAEWFVSLQSGELSRERKAEFAHWLCRSPAHVREFLQLTALQADLARVPDLKSFDVEAELAKLATICPPANVVSLEGADVPPRKPSITQTRAVYSRTWRLGPTAATSRGGAPPTRRFLFAGAAMTSLLAVGLSTGPIRDYLHQQHYITEVGEQRALTLADGSLVQLNALSTLSVEVGESARELQLEDGEALFRVAKDPSHPFRVHTPQATIEAKGTRFNVHVSKNKTVIALLEGHVLVTPPSQSGGSGITVGSDRASHSVMLNPGEEVSIATDANDLPSPHRVDVNAVVAWTGHRLIFEDAPLSEVIADFNRYSRQPFAISDAELGSARITISFDANSMQTFADALTAVGGLRVVQQTDGTRLIERN